MLSLWSPQASVREAGEQRLTGPHLSKPLRRSKNMVNGNRLLRLKGPPVIATQDGADFEDAFARRVRDVKFSQEIETGVREDEASVLEALRVGLDVVAHEVLGVRTGWQAVRVDPDI